MKLLVIGSGGREHAIAWRLTQSPRVQKVYVAPGNGGTATEPGLENLPLTDIQALAQFAQDEGIQLTVVGPEAPALEVGDPVICRHAKAGELAERFNRYLLFRGERVVDAVPTYRGLGQCFF